MMKITQLIPVLILALSLFQGCGPKEWKVKVVPARGSVSINGSPAEGVMVTLNPKEGHLDTRESKPWALTRADGTFTLTTYDFEDGAPAGIYDVLIRWPDDPQSFDAIDMLGGAYSKPEKSQWQMTVAKGSPELPPIRIDGAKILKPAAKPPETNPANGVRPNRQR